MSSVIVLCQYPSDNVAADYATIGVNTGSEDTDYPAACLADGRLGRPAKLTTTSGSWVFSFSGAQRVDLVALGPHNLATATIQGNATNSWGSPTLSESFTISAETADGHSVNAWLDLTTKTGYSAGGFQYWRLLVTSASNCAVGELWLGSSIRTLRSYMPGFTLEEDHPVITHLTEFLVPLIYSLGSRERRLKVSFLASEVEAGILREWYRSMKGAGLTGLLIPDSVTNDAWWVRHGADYTEKVNYRDLRDVSMTLIEHATGVPL